MLGIRASARGAVLAAISGALFAGCAYDFDTPFRCSNGVKDGDETDVDCGGSCAHCGRTKACSVDADCAPYRCVEDKCGFTPLRFWRSLTGDTAPPARFGAALAPAGDGTLVLFGGEPVAGMPLADTWVFHGDTNQWEGPFTASPHPTPQPYASMAEDKSLPAAVFLGRNGETYTWAKGAWTQAQPATLAYFGRALAYDPVGKKMLAFGGTDANATLSNDLLARSSLDGVWKPAGDIGPPPGRYDMVGVFDEARSRLVIYGGMINGGASANSATWEYDPAGNTWLQRNNGGGPNSPPPRYGAAAAYDEEKKVVVMYGGRDGPNGQAYSDTWEWDGTSWSNPAYKGPAPTTRFFASMAYDAPRHRLILFGGTSNFGGGAKAETYSFSFLAGPCSTDADCGSSSCVEGICCSTASCAETESCAVPGHAGSCFAKP